MKTICESCQCELTDDTRQHYNSRLCKNCYGKYRICTQCAVPKTLDNFYGTRDYKCRDCVKLLNRPGEKQCRTCLETFPAITFPLNSKDCSNCFNLRRRCTKCLAVHTLDQFHTTASGNGLRRVCKNCVAKQRNDAYHQRERQCRICNETYTSFPMNSQICAKCFGRFSRCTSCNQVKPTEEMRANRSQCIECAREVDRERRREQPRTCTQCHTEKPPTEFMPFKRVCNECRNSSFQTCGTCGINQPLTEFSSRNPKNATGFEKRCDTCNREKQRASNLTIQGRFNSARATSKCRHQDFTIPFEEYAKLIQQPCHYCGHKLNDTGSGLDRINPLLGYTVENVVPCCRPCNWTKSNYFTYDEMIVIGKAIGLVKHNREQHGTTLPESNAISRE